MPYVYVIHFAEPVGTARHYTGFAQNRDHLEKRISAHRRGIGSSLTSLAVERGIEWRVVRLYKVDSFRDEKRVKRYAKFLCPVCQYEHMLKAVLPGDYEHSQIAAD
jgi:predicted GIY-YIG superfamily endonuclease